MHKQKVYKTWEVSTFLLASGSFWTVSATNTGHAILTAPNARPEESKALSRYPSHMSMEQLKECLEALERMQQ